MTDEVYTDCPDCGAEIPFYKTVDDLKACPDCGTSSAELFEMAIGDDQCDQPLDAPGLNILTAAEAEVSQ